MSTGQPDGTAARVALWRALHVEADPPPHVLEDRIGLALLAPGDGWRGRGDMDVEFSRPFRASIVARARFIEDLVLREVARGVDQYVILGAGLDSFAQRRPVLAADLTVFEADQRATQAWKRRRLVELGYGVPDRLRFVPVDFEAGGWRDALDAAGFDAGRPAVVASTGVSMYLSREANVATLREVAALAPGSSFAMTFLQPLERADPEVRPGLEMAVSGARASGTPFISFFTAEQIQALARDVGFRQVRHVPATELAQRYFARRPDGLRPPDGAEELLLAVA